MSKVSAGTITKRRMIDEGWEFDHEALYFGYCAAGSTSKMQTRNGYEYRRVHYGYCVGSKYTYQITDVMRRKITDNHN